MQFFRKQPCQNFCLIKSPFCFFAKMQRHGDKQDSAPRQSAVKPAYEKINQNFCQIFNAVVFESMNQLSKWPSKIGSDNHASQVGIFAAGRTNLAIFGNGFAFRTSESFDRDDLFLTVFAKPNPFFLASRAFFGED